MAARRAQDAEEAADARRIGNTLAPWLAKQEAGIEALADGILRGSGSFSRTT